MFSHRIYMALGSLIRCNLPRLYQIDIQRTSFSLGRLGTRPCLIRWNRICTIICRSKDSGRNRRLWPSKSMVLKWRITSKKVGIPQSLRVFVIISSVQSRLTLEISIGLILQLNLQVSSNCYLNEQLIESEMVNIRVELWEYCIVFQNSIDYLKLKSLKIQLRLLRISNLLMSDWYTELIMYLS